MGFDTYATQHERINISQCVDTIGWIIHPPVPNPGRGDDGQGKDGHGTYHPDTQRVTNSNIHI
jgi:hypothetical protein